MMAATPAFTDRVQDCSGLCFPSPPGASVDLLRALSARALALRARALAREHAAAAEGEERLLLAAVLEAFDRISPARLPALFSTPLAYLDLQVGRDRSDLVDPRTEHQRALALVRHLIGHPDGPELTAVLPAALLGENGLFLPHLAALLRTDSGLPVAVNQRKGRLRLVWADGMAITLPLGGGGLPMGFARPRLHPVPRAAGVPVLNPVPEVRATFGGYEFAEGRELIGAAERFAAGIDLLGRAWPLAHDGLGRFLGGIVLLASRDYERSDSPARMLGAVLLTAGQPATVGDLLSHEVSHIRMHLFNEVDPLFLTDPEREAKGFESPWRPDRRPLQGILLGVHAFLNVCVYYRRLFDDPVWGEGARRIHARQKANVERGWELLAAEGRPTVLGRTLLPELSAAVDALRGTRTAR